MTETDKKWMERAIEMAQNAASIDEVPIGAVIVGPNGAFLSEASNRTITDIDPTAHAEILALRIAAKLIKNYRLIGATVYSTIEPCAMCAGALVNARIARLVFGAFDERFGGAVTHFGICSSDKLNHRIEIESGVLAEECRTLMLDFFKARRVKAQPSA